MGSIARSTLPLLASALLASAARPSSDHAEALERLASHLPERAAAAFAELTAVGDPAVEAALAGFSDQPAAARRARARLFAAAASDATLAPIVALAADPDPAVRRWILVACARPQLRAADGFALRVGTLSARLEREDDAALRESILETLGRLESSQALDALERAIDDLAGEERRLAARALASRAAGRVRVVAIAERALAADADRSADLLIEWLSAGLGEGLAERTVRGGESAALDVFSRAARHPARAVRARVGDALDAFVARLRYLGEHDRAQALFPRMLGRGLLEHEALLAGARFALESGRSPEDALGPARELVRRLGEVGDVTRRPTLATAHVLVGAAELAARRFDAADESFERAAAVLDAWLEEHPERYEPALADLVIDALELRAVCETWRALARIADGAGPAEERVLERALAAHRFSLRAHALASEASDEWLRRLSASVGSLDDVFAHAVGPVRLFAFNDRAGGFPRDLRLRALQRLGDALATVAPEEFPGFRAAAVAVERADFARDPARIAIFDEMRRSALARVRLLQPELRQTARETLSDDDAWAGYLHARRLPGDFALQCAALLRIDGRVAESRELAERVIAALEESPARRFSLAPDELLARAEAAVGNACTDAGQGDEADRMLNRALERLTALESSMRERAAGRLSAENAAALRFADRLRGERADTLTSLAVNANVKRRRPDLALEYFERSLELEQDAFSTVLLACYRARAGRSAEALALLAEIPDAPGNYYNLACTWALLGVEDAALSYLAREFNDPDASRGSRERQKAWARDDPDLASLRDDPRFQELVR